MEPSYLARVVPSGCSTSSFGLEGLSISLVSWFYTSQRPLLWGAQTQAVELDSRPSGAWGW